MATIIDGNGIVTAEGTSTTQGRLRLGEDTDNGTNYVELQAPASVASNVTFTLPSADGTNGQVLQTNGSGTLSFATPSSGALVYIASATASNSASLVFTNIGSTYDVYVFELVKILPATDGAEFFLKTSTNNGSTYNADYSSASINFVNESGGSVAGNRLNDVQLLLTSGKGIGNAGQEQGWSGVIRAYKPSAAAYLQFTYQATFDETAGNQVTVTGAGRSNAASDVDAIQFIMGSGNITSGVIRLYGVANS